MDFTSIGFGQTCSRSILPRRWASTTFIPSIRSAPKVVFLATAFLGMLLHSFQMSRDLPQFSLFGRGQIRFDVLRIAAEQVNACTDHHVKVDDPCAAALPLALCRPTQLPRSAGARDHVSFIRTVDQKGGYGVDFVRADQLRGLRLELRQLQDRNLAHTIDRKSTRL